MREPRRASGRARLLVLVVLPCLAAACTSSPTPAARGTAREPAVAQRSSSMSPPTVAVATLAGRLVASAWKTSPLLGTVTARGPKKTYTVTVGPSGQFSMTVQPGTYTVTARSPLYGQGAATCRYPGVVHAPARAVLHVEVECVEK